MTHFPYLKYFLAGMLLFCITCAAETNADTQSTPSGTLKVSSTELTLIPGDYEVLHATIESAVPEISGEDFSLVDAKTGNIPMYISMQPEEKEDGEGTFGIAIRDRGTGRSYTELVKLICPKAGLASEPFTVRSAPRMPAVYITAESPVASKDIWVKGTIRIDGGNQFKNLEEMATEIKGRGNTTWNWKKKPYTLKLNKKQAVLGMPEHKRWNLLANYMDRTHLRNRVAYYVGQHSKLAWTPRNEYVEVYFNNGSGKGAEQQYVGLYLLTEQIKEDNDRLNITKMKAADIEGDAVTGGYLLEIDTNWDEAKKFESTGTRLPVNIKYPESEDLIQQQLDYIQSYFNMADNTIKAAAGGNTQNGMFNYFDVASLVDYWLIYELMANHEPLNPKSVYFHKDRKGPLVAGPIWDFDWGTLRPDRVRTWQLYGKTNTNEHARGLNWWNIFLKDKEFRAQVKARWTEWYPFLQTVPEFIDREQAAITTAEARNHIKWPDINGLYLNNINGDEHLSFFDAAARLRQSFADHVEWMNTQIMKW